MEEESKKKSNIWLWLAPLYILLLIPLIKWTMKMYSPDIELSKEDLSAFSGDGNIDKEDYKLREPNLEDVGFAINYKNQGSAVGSEDYYAALDRKYEEMENAKTKEKTDTEKKQSNSSHELEKKEQNEYNKQVDSAKKGQMMSIGHKQGFLTKTVGNLMNNPSGVKALFNNSFVVRGFMNRDTVKAALSNPKALENFLTKSDKVSNFLGNSIVKNALNNKEIVGTIASSNLIGEIMKSPAVQGLMSDGEAMNRILNNNPQLAQLLNNPNVTGAIMSNPQTAQAMMNIQSSHKN